MAAAELVRALIEPIIEHMSIEGRGCELYDVEYESGVLRVSVDADGGIDVDTIGELAKLISDILDEKDPIPDSKYLLEVTSPGVERKLRTPAHFQKQVGETVAVKLRAPVDGERRLQSKLVSVDENGIEIEHAGATLKIAFDDLESARSVFDWDSLTNDTRTDKDKSANKKKAAS